MGGRVGWGLRERGHGPRAVEVTPLELFFDVVYVLAVTQLTHFLVEHLSWRGAAEAAVLLLIVWGTWIHVVWTTNYFDLRTRPMRLALFAVMFASLLMAASLPHAFGAGGFLFAAAAVANLAGWSLFFTLAVGRGHHLRPVFVRVLVWEVVAGAGLLAGAMAADGARFWWWLAAVAAIYGAMWLGFPVPGFGRNRTTDYTIAAEHMAERCRLFVILALGESILVTGAGFGNLPGSAPTTAAFVAAFVGSLALWWLYFDRAEGAARRRFADAADPGAIGLSAYTYDHIPLVAGIVVAAAADETVIAHPTDPVGVAAAALILGGPLLYLAGNAAFKRTIWGYVPPSRYVAAAALLALVPLPALARPAGLTLAVLAAAVLLALAAWDAAHVPALASEPEPAATPTLDTGLKPGDRVDAPARDATAPGPGPGPGPALDRAT